jgi:hypothetical protein
MSADGSYLLVTLADEPLRLEKYDSIKQQKIITMFVLSKLQPSPSGRSNPHQSPHLKIFPAVYEHSWFWRREDEKFDERV